MSLYHTLRDSFGQDSPEERLKILRHEMITPISAIRGCAALLEKMEQEALPRDPEKVLFCIQTLKKAGDDLRDVLDALTSSTERTP
jgi:nitrogen-specific signal transduction histidine kinase